AGKGSDGSSGSDGRTGHGGDGGHGGMVVVHYDARHPELARLVELDTRGGRGGDGREVGTDGRNGAPALFAPERAGALFAAELARGVPVER
ncbi:MAG: hypothetical protein KF773_39305, partial [Deltaproteobacteria bacterium]|nr:hypothetical protein [Deltaproteobacteria bacterium]